MKNVKGLYKFLSRFHYVMKADFGCSIVAESGKDHGDCDCFGVAVLTHGKEGKLFGKDELISIESFVDPIKNCKSLAGKPKLFFFQVNLISSKKRLSRKLLLSLSMEFI